MKTAEPNAESNAESSAESDAKAVIIRISGRVQGVWFRAWTKQEADRRALRGWVRNRHDGTVEALFSGPSLAVDEMVAACRSGPPLAEVDEVTTLPLDENAPEGFEIRSSG